MYAKVLDKLLNIVGELVNTFKEYEKYVYPKVYYTRLGFIICYILCSIAFILSFIIFCILVLWIYLVYKKNQKKLKEEQNISAFKFIRDGLIKYLKQTYGDNAYDFVSLLIDDSIRSENQKDSQTREIIKFITEIPMLLITSFIGYSIGVITESGLKNPLTITTVIILLLLFLIRIIKWTYSAIKNEFPFFKGEKKRFLLSVLQDVKYKLLEVDGTEKK